MILYDVELILGVTLVAIVIELAFGWPAVLMRTIRHPVVWLGSAVTLMEGLFRRGVTRIDLMTGTFMTLFLCTLVIAVGYVTWDYFSTSTGGLIVIALLCASMMAARNLYNHVEVVQTALRRDGQDSLEPARCALAQIVGRDTQDLDEAGICAGAIETLSESTSDGVVAPVFWLLVLGMPGLLLYKAVNTMDSMVGHRNPRYEYFGKFAARLDDVLNWIPARLTALMYWVASFSARPSQLGQIAFDARQHASPNAGWPEAVLARLLNISLGGRRSYQGVVFEAAVFNAGAVRPGQNDLAAAVQLYWRVIVLLVVVIAAGFAGQAL